MSDPGWYSDAGSNGQLRWWDGANWGQLQSPPDAPVGYGTPYSPHGGPSPFASLPPYPPTTGSARNVSVAGLLRTNKFAMIAVLIAGIYIGLAAATHVVLFGILPAVLTFRSFQAKEKLAPVALVASVVAIGIAFIVLH